MKCANQGEAQILPCPRCGCAPRIISGIIGGYYVACLGHAETPIVDTSEQAIQLWNSSEFET